MFLYHDETSPSITAVSAPSIIIIIIIIYSGQYLWC